MICPNCGYDTPSEQAFCANCGTFVRKEFGKVFSNEPLASDAAAGAEGSYSGPSAINDADTDRIQMSFARDTDPELWPSETVFIPYTEGSPEAVSDDRPPATEIAFEDAQADDFFEQSLSGQIRREDLIEARKEYVELRPEPDVERMPKVSPSAPVEAEPEEDLHAQTIGRVTQTGDRTAGDFIPSDATALPTVTGDRKRIGGLRMVLMIIGSGVLLIAVFGGGFMVGKRSVMPEATVETNPQVEPVVETAPDLNAPPPGMAYVPGGEFRMGSDDGDGFSRPAHTVTVSPYFIDITEVTNRAYRDFVRATGHDPPPGWAGETFPESVADDPVTGVTWYEAAEYAAWMGKRLPTEAEWEFAARGSDGRTYPWGDQWEPTLSNTGNASKDVRTVGQGGQSPFGLFDMAGNAWEWTSSDARAYPGGKEFPRSPLLLKIIRGGNWKSDQKTASTFFRGYYGAAGERDYLGTSFRCVKDLPKNQ